MLVSVENGGTVRHYFNIKVGYGEEHKARQIAYYLTYGKICTDNQMLYNYTNIIQAREVNESTVAAVTMKTSKDYAKLGLTD